MAGRLMLLDSASLYFRAFFGVPDTMRAPDGTPVNAVRGFLDMIAMLVARRRPDRLVACWDDDWRPAFRVAALPSYKAHRLVAPGSAAEQTPDALSVQVPVIVQALAALGVARVGAAGLEADDVIATLATREATAGPADVDVVTGDRDLFQLVDDDAVIRVLYTGRGVRNAETVDQAWLAARYGIGSGAGYADLAMLRGDPSDGLPGVPGVGEKTAAALLTRYGSLAALLAALDDGAPDLASAAGRRLRAARDYLAVAPTVVHVVRDGDVAVPADQLPVAPADPDAVLALAQRWNLGSSLARVIDTFAADSGGARDRSAAGRPERAGHSAAQTTEE